MNRLSYWESPVEAPAGSTHCHGYSKSWRPIPAGRGGNEQSDDPTQVLFWDNCTVGGRPTDWTVFCLSSLPDWLKNLVMLFVLDVLYAGYGLITSTYASLYNGHGLRFLFPFSSLSSLDMISLIKARADGWETRWKRNVRFWFRIRY